MTFMDTSWPDIGPKLLTRDQFRESVFKRDDHKCLVCKAPAIDSHHLIERRAFPDGGYYLDNGASVCGEHHMMAEQTLLSCNELRALAGIKTIILPPHLCPKQAYDKWCNPIQDNGTRLKGELFNDPSVQKVLEPVLHLFVDRVKYPRTFHLPWSPGKSNDDKVLDSVEQFAGKEVVVTVKIDGENSTIYRDYMHARSMEYHPHPSRTMMKQIHSRVKNDIPEGWRVCGENSFAKHSLKYNYLEDYFLVFSIWNSMNECLSWSDTVEWCELMDLKHVPVLYTGFWNEELIKSLYQETINNDPCEGYVVRLADSFHYKEFKSSVAKYVRENHVTTGDHWMNQELERNNLNANI